MAGSQCGHLMVLQPSILGALRRVVFGPGNGHWSGQIPTKQYRSIIYGVN